MKTMYIKFVYLTIKERILFTFVNDKSDYDTSPRINRKSTYTVKRVKKL